MSERGTGSSTPTPAPKPGQKSGSPDELIKGDKAKTELTEDDLKKVSGGLKMDYKGG